MRTLNFNLPLHRNSSVPTRHTRPATWANHKSLQHRAHTAQAPTQLMQHRHDPVHVLTKRTTILTHFDASIDAQAHFKMGNLSSMSATPELTFNVSDRYLKKVKYNKFIYTYYRSSYELYSPKIHFTRVTQNVIFSFPPKDLIGRCGVTLASLRTCVCWGARTHAPTHAHTYAPWDLRRWDFRSCSHTLGVIPFAP